MRNIRWLVAGIFSALAQPVNAQVIAQSFPHRATRDTAVADSGFASATERHRAIAGTLEASQLTVAGGGLGLSGRVRGEGVIAPHLAYWGSKWAIIGTPKVLLRMLSDSSAPVRSPSYMPRITVFRTLGKNFPHDSQLDILSLTVSHHSNGQSGPFYRDTTRDSVNYETGSFSTNYLEFAYLNILRSTNKRRPMELGLRIGFRVHFPINEDPELRELRGENQYGRYRFLFSTQTALASTRVRYAFEYMLDRKVGTERFFSRRRLIGSVSTAWIPNGWNDVGVFLQYYYGQDYYNIQYIQRVSAVRAGFTLRSLSGLQQNDL
jgi:Phospholipase A1